MVQMRYLGKVNIKVWLPFNTLTCVAIIFSSYYFAKLQRKEADGILFHGRSQKYL